MEGKDYVTLDVAKLLKEKGYDKECNSYIVKVEGSERDACDKNTGDLVTLTSVLKYPKPLLYDAQKWLREKHKIAICIHPYDFNWDYTLFDLTKTNNNDDNHHHLFLSSMGLYKTYENALNAGIKETLKRI